MRVIPTSPPWFVFYAACAFCGINIAAAILFDVLMPVRIFFAVVALVAFQFIAYSVRQIRHYTHAAKAYYDVRNALFAAREYKHNALMAEYNREPADLSAIREHMLWLNRSDDVIVNGMKWTPADYSPRNIAVIKQEILVIDSGFILRS
jgi:hypothetical protein